MATTKAWIVESGNFEIDRAHFAMNYNLVDPGKAVGTAPPPPPPPPPPDPGDGGDLPYVDLMWYQRSLISKITSLPIGIDSWFADDGIGGYGKTWYPESDIYWIGPHVHPLPADPRDTESASISFYMPPKPDAATARIDVALRPYLNWNPGGSTWVAQVTNAMLNAVGIPPLAPYSYPVSASPAFRFRWKVVPESIIYDGMNELLVSHQITGSDPPESPPANSTVHAIIDAQVKYSYQYDKKFSAVQDDPVGTSVTDHTPTDAELDTPDPDSNTGTWAFDTWTCDEEGWYGIVGKTIFKKPDPVMVDGSPFDDIRGGFHYTLFVINEGTDGDEQENTSGDAGAMNQIALNCMVRHFHVGDTVKLRVWQNYQKALSDAYWTLNLTTASELSVYKLVMV